MNPSQTTSETLVSVAKRGKLWIITGHRMSNAGVDAWAEAVVAYRQAMAPSTERYLIYDTLPIKNMSMTSYLRRRATELAEADREADGRVAVLINVPRMLMHIFDIFATLSGRHLQPKLAVKFFQNMDDAIAWVEAAMPTEALKQGGA